MHFAFCIQERLIAMEKQKFYITTPIYYPSDKLHIGHSYCTVAADTIARYKRAQGYDVMFLTGTDEHGQKIQRIAEERGVSPQEYVDNIVAGIKELWKTLDITNDKFIRTTDEMHVKAVQKIFNILYEKGDIYKSEYEGWYCTPCESFWTEHQLVDGKCPDCGRAVEKTKEESYFFKLSKYQDRLIDLIKNNPDFLQPSIRQNEMLNNFLIPGLEDLCVSRTSFDWGIPVEFDPKHVVYVWLDALTNYITALGAFSDDDSDFKKYWPADVHLVGKEIVRFHSIIWPAMLMALDLPLPKQVYGHPWLLFGTDKMSKSKGNVIYADELTARFGVDAVRHYLLSEMPHATDGSISYETIIERFNSDLANTLGNLVNRTVAMINKYFDGVLPCSCKSEELDNEFKADILSALPVMEKAFDDFRIADAVEAVINSAKRSNKYIDETAPWALAKDEANKERLSTVLYNLLEAIRIIAVELSPFMPDTSKAILSQINCDEASYESILTFGAAKTGVKVAAPTPLFNRIDATVMLAEIEKEMKEKMAAAQNAAEIEGVAKIGIEDFAKVDLRVAEIVECEPVKKAKKLLKLTVFDGAGKRTVASGIAKWYKPEDLIGKKMILVSNLKPATLCGIESQGMILAADCSEDDVKVIFVDGIPAGSKVR